MADNNENLARVTSVRSEMEGGVIVGGLEDRGIKATMSGVYTTNFRAEAPGWVAHSSTPAKRDAISL